MVATQRKSTPEKTWGPRMPAKPSVIWMPAIADHGQRHEEGPARPAGAPVVETEDSGQDGQHQHREGVGRMGDQQPAVSGVEEARPQPGLADGEAEQHGGQDAKLLDLHGLIVPDLGLM